MFFIYKYNLIQDLIFYEFTCVVFPKLIYDIDFVEFASQDEEMSADVIRKSFLKTEEEFISIVRDQWCTCPQIASVGTCCLVGVICNGLIYIANAGDSRVVLGRVERGGKGISAIQLSEEHNVNREPIRDELRALHPEDPKIVVMKHNVWRVKGLIQVLSFKFLMLLNCLFRGSKSGLGSDTVAP